ncbi:hypothetical protein PG994_015355 [Apiospora phragmitis]|uniref:Uncharacterized protein n=1 Tax=Apiospora phragmitis TaxID=2905665 RepID=A0ABR1STK3_9PEZI
MASTDEWEVSLLVSEIVMAFTLLSAVFTFLSVACAFLVTEVAVPRGMAVFAAYPKTFNSLCFIEALATCVASIVLFIFGLNRQAYWLVFLPTIWQSLAFARSICLRMMHAPLGWLLIPAACVIDMATAGFFVGAVVCAYQSSETSAKVLTLIPSILSGICVAIWTSYYILQINKMPPETKSKSRGLRNLFIVITVQQACSVLSFASFRIKSNLPDHRLAASPPRGFTSAGVPPQGEAQMAQASNTSRVTLVGGISPEGADGSERTAFGNDVPETTAKDIHIGIIDCHKLREFFPKQPHIAALGYKFMITFVDQVEAKGQDILVRWKDGGPVASLNKETGSSQITVGGQVQNTVDYVQSVLCSVCLM